jgi:cytochrome b involved in lipid metabolism
MEEKETNQERRFLADRAVTASELATHATYAGGLWTSFGGIVYDITNFVHPGGKSAI